MDNYIETHPQSELQVISTKPDENSNLKTEETFEQIDLKIEKQEVVSSVNKEEYFRTNNTNSLHFRMKPHFVYKKIGNTLTFCLNKDGEPLIVIGPHWPFFLCLASTISLISYLFFYAFWNALNVIVRTIGLGIYIIQITSYTYTFLINPGYPKIDSEAITGNSKERLKFCNDCHIWVKVENNVTHCFDCNTCVEGYDHHCPWTSKCIGRGNLYGFYVFVTSTMGLFAFLMFGLTLAQVPKNI